MKKVLGLSFCLFLLCSVSMLGKTLPTFGFAIWKGTTATALLPITVDFDRNNNPQTVRGDFFNLYMAEGIVYEVEIFYSSWKSSGSPSSFDIVYPDGQKTTIRIANYSSSSPAGGGSGKPVYLKQCTDDLVR